MPHGTCIWKIKKSLRLILSNLHRESSDLHPDNQDALEENMGVHVNFPQLDKHYLITKNPTEILPGVIGYPR